MLENLVNSLCGFERLAFESDFDLDESIRRLAVEVKAPLLGYRPLVSLKSTVVVGISKERVSLWCERLFFANGFRPVFAGDFRIVAGRVILIGKMRMDGGIYLWVGAGLLMALIATLGPLSELARGAHDPVLWVMPMFGPVVALFPLVVLRIAKWLSSGDERWLLAAIVSALRKRAGTSC